MNSPTLPRQEGPLQVELRMSTHPAIVRNLPVQFGDDDNADANDVGLVIPRSRNITLKKIEAAVDGWLAHKDHFDGGQA